MDELDLMGIALIRVVCRRNRGIINRSFPLAPDLSRTELLIAEARV